jgi:hypothetical protein
MLKVFLYFFPKVEKRAGLCCVCGQEPSSLIGLYAVCGDEWMFFAKGVFYIDLLVKGGPGSNNYLQIRDV